MITVPFAAFRAQMGAFALFNECGISQCNDDILDLGLTDGKSPENVDHRAIRCISCTKGAFA